MSDESLGVRSLRAMAILAIGSVVGVLTAAMAVKYVGANGSVHSGPWSSAIDAGGAKRGPYTRAAIALGATLALSREETIYFLASKDDDGDALRSSCNYSIKGQDLPARWWSITLYGQDHYLIENPQNRWSYSSADVAHDADGGFTIAVSRTPQPGNWLDPAQSSGLVLVTRLYQPQSQAAANPAAIALPHIIKQACS
jgi:hypothetical protein